MDQWEDQEVTVWDEWGSKCDIGDVERWDEWDKCMNASGFPKGLVHFLKSTDRGGCGFPKPTPIQAYSWAALVTGKDFIGVARTGSGKTLAFLLPGFMWLKRNKKTSEAVDTNIGPAILVLTPTRELCFQIYSDADKFGTPVKLTAACAYGGADKWQQEQKLREGPDTLIATPGRLADFLRTGTVSLEMCRYVTLDEADRMLDMGFDPQVKEILDFVPHQKQVSMFTATWPAGVRQLADKYISNPVQVQVGSEKLEANKDVDQKVVLVHSEDEKRSHLDAILAKMSNKVTLIFCNAKKKVRDLAWELHPHAVELHGDLTQAQRDESLRKFKEGEANVLVATDVASRGLDVRTCACVVNYDAPNRGDGEDYVHRIGRTGRAGDKGIAYTFLTEWDTKQAQAILNVMENGSVMPPEELREMIHGRFRATGLDNDQGWGEEPSAKRPRPSSRAW